MKRISLIILLAVVVLSGMAQNIGEAFYIYRNDGQFNAFFRDEVQSIEYSYYDADSVKYEEIVTQVVITADSVYKIPLALIDSVGFVTPETKYKEDAVVLSGSLFDYLISADSLVLTFSSSIPYSLLPKVSDKLVTMELTDKLPCGFAGKVRSIENIGNNITVYCDSLAFEEAVSRFYGVVEIVSQQQGGEVHRYLPRRAPIATYTYFFNPNLPDFNLPVSLEGVISPRTVFKSFEGRASANMHITPTLTGRAVYIIDDLVVPNHYEIHAVTDLKTESVLDVAGVAKGEFVNWWFNKDVPMPWGIPLYLAFGPMLEVEGDVAMGFNLRADVRHIEDITYYPAASYTPLTQMMFNRVDQTTQITRFDMNWRYFALRGSAKVGFKARVGLPLPVHDVAWVGGEFQFGERVDAELNVNFDAIEQAETGTAFYEALKSSNVSEMSYGGAQFCVMGLNDRLKLKFGRDDYDFGGKRINWDLLPIFSDTKAQSSGSSAKASANITNNCIIPYTVGFALFDENGNRIGEPHWNAQEYRLHNDFIFPFETTFSELATNKKYKVYPSLRLLGFTVLASPSADLDTHFPVTLSDFKVTKSQYKKKGFKHDGVDYDYRFDVSVTATLDEEAKGIADWGYMYQDPFGNPPAQISLKNYGSSYTDTRWAYFRNEPKSTCTLYGYVKYVGSNEPVYGEPYDYPLEYESTITVHTLSASNIGESSATIAGKVEGYTEGLDDGEVGFYYNTTGNPSQGNGQGVSAGRLSSISDGDFQATLSNLQQDKTYYYRTYYYSDGEYTYGETRSFKTNKSGGTGVTSCPNGNHPHWIDLGLPSGTQWRCCNEGASAPEAYGGYYAFGQVSSAPTEEQIQELKGYCSYEWTTLNGVYGGKFTGPNGGTIFLPAAGYRWVGGFSSVGSSGCYWSSTPLDAIYAYGLYFDSLGPNWYFDNRSYELSVRPVR